MYAPGDVHQQPMYYLDEYGNPVDEYGQPIDPSYFQGYEEQQGETGDNGDDTPIAMDDEEEFPELGGAGKIVTKTMKKTKRMRRRSRTRISHQYETVTEEVPLDDNEIKALAAKKKAEKGGAFAAPPGGVRASAAAFVPTYTPANAPAPPGISGPRPDVPEFIPTNFNPSAAPAPSQVKVRAP